MALDSRTTQSCKSVAPVVSSCKGGGGLDGTLFADGYQRKQDEETGNDVDEESDKTDECEDGLSDVELNRPHPSQQQPHPSDDVNNGTAVDRDLDQIIYNVSSFLLVGHVQSEAKIRSSNLQRLTKVTLAADCWDVGTTPAATFENLILGS